MITYENENEARLIQADEEWWSDNYRPIINPNNGTYLFEEYGKDLEYVTAMAEQNKVWTWVEENGMTAIINGFHYLNRLGYYVTEVPWEDGQDITIVVEDND